MSKTNGERILLVRTAWMKYYEGRANIDIPRSGAKYILKNKKGGELNNFKNRAGKFYGYIPFVSSLNIQNLGAKTSDEKISGITVIFCATHPVEKGMRIVGWYENATVYRNRQSNKFNDWYFIEANAKKVTRIDAENRFCNIPNTFGRSAVFYFSLHPEKKETLNKVLNYINSGGALPEIENSQEGNSKSPRQPDIDKRIKVETAAINLSKKYYSKRYGKSNVKSVEKDNVGWDLEISTGSVILKVEVKGLSGSKMAVELTPNEFKALSKRQETYYLFIVTNSLSSKPDYEIFSCQRKGDILIGNKKTELRINKVISARIN